MYPYLSVLRDSPLFRGAEVPQLEKLLGCLGGAVRSYRKGEYIFLAGHRVTHVGLVLWGDVQVLKEDHLGNRTILASLEAGQLFGEVLACAKVPAAPVSVLAVRESGVLWLEYGKITTPCKEVCPFHKRLIENLLAIVAQRAMLLNQKLEHVTKRTTREKLLSYLADQRRQAGQRRFSIPYNRQQLADYLCVERSAMSAELGRMRAQGLIDFHKNHFQMD